MISPIADKMHKHVGRGQWIRLDSCGAVVLSLVFSVILSTSLNNRDCYGDVKYLCTDSRRCGVSTGVSPSEFPFIVPCYIYIYIPSPNDIIDTSRQRHCPTIRSVARAMYNVSINCPRPRIELVVP
jgi:hypothetical protein